MRIAVMAAGAVGGYYGGRMAAAGLGRTELIDRLISLAMAR